MVANIEKIGIDLKSDSYNGVSMVKISFKFPCTYTFLNIGDLKEIIRAWIRGEEIKYPQPKFKGRWLLFEEIKKLFDEGIEKPELIDPAELQDKRIGVFI